MKRGHAGRTPHPSPSNALVSNVDATVPAAARRANGNARLTLTPGLPAFRASPRSPGTPRAASDAPCSLGGTHVPIGDSPGAHQTVAKGLSMKHSASRDLFAHWNERRGARPLPERGEIEPAAIRAALGDTFILGAEPGEDLRFRLAGTRVCALFGRELKDEPFTALWDAGHHAAMRRLLAAVAEEETGVVAGARARTPEGFSCDLELLLLPLRHRGLSGRRMLGALAPLAVPVWLGASRLDPLSLVSLRYLADSLEPTAPSRLAASFGHEQARRDFVVYEGGRS
jgi:hypothetical protein